MATLRETVRTGVNPATELAANIFPKTYTRKFRILDSANGFKRGSENTFSFASKCSVIFINKYPKNKS